jgi:hypothetical protein
VYGPPEHLLQEAIMPIASSDILYKLSVTTGAAGNSTAQGTPANSLGKYISTTAIVDNTLDNLFDDVTGDENAASNVDYMCFFVHNNHATITWLNPIVWITVPGTNTTVAIGLDPAGVTAKGSSSAQAATIANDLAAPAGVTFTAPSSKGAGLAIGNIPAGSVQAIWVRRTAANSAALNNDGCTIRVEGDTTA